MALCDNNFDVKIAKTVLQHKFWDSYKVRETDEFTSVY